MQLKILFLCSLIFCAGCASDKAYLNTLMRFGFPGLVDTKLHEKSLTWMKSQKIPSGTTFGGFDFSGLYKSYAGEDHPVSEYLVKTGRIWVYDQALGIYAQLKAGDHKAAKQAVNALVGIAKVEEERGYKGLWHFFYNTAGNYYIDRRGPLGANLWAINAIYAYILSSGDATHLAWLNWQVKSFIFSQQVLDEADRRYGLFRAGYYGEGDWADKPVDEYPGDPNLQNEHVFIEHNADAAGTLRLAFRAVKKFKVKDDEFRKELIRRHELLIKGIMSLWKEDHFVTAIDPDGAVNNSVAVDNQSWVGAVILPYDKEKAWEAIKYLRKHFAVILDKGEMLKGNIKDPEKKSITFSKPAMGLCFFSADFEDLYIKPNPDFKYMIQPEATLGAITFLKVFMDAADDLERKEHVWEFMEKLMDGMHTIYKAYGGNALPNSTLNIADVFLDMGSMNATATFSVVADILKGAPDDDFIYIEPPKEFTVNGAVPDLK
ncbi:hypothetical protein ACFL6Y_04535 [Elusimicrobiota bacterium]